MCCSTPSTIGTGSGFGVVVVVVVLNMVMVIKLPLTKEYAQVNKKDLTKTSIRGIPRNLLGLKIQVGAEGS